jgi:LacI family transcriptional regulator
MARVTVRDIAEHLGLSIFTVSRSLSGKDGVSEATRRVVVDAAAKLGYRATIRPASAEGGQIGLVFHDQDPVNGDLHVQLQNGVQREASRLDKSVRLQWAHDPDQIAQFARTTAGVLMVGPHDRVSVQKVRDLGVPVVRLGWVDALEQIDQVSGTNREGGQAVAEYLIGLGHRSIGYVQGTPGFRGRVERYMGLRDVIERHPGVSVHNLDFDGEHGFLKAFKALKAKGTVPTAFFCAHDGLALSAMSELMQLGYRIPDDISVVGFFDYALAKQVSPQLTTVRVEGVEMGAAALRLLVDRLDGNILPGAPARRVQIVSTLIERSSAGPRAKVSRIPSAKSSGRPSSAA